MKKLYTAVVTAQGGRNGHIKSSDGILEMELRKPHETGGQGGASNPEQLFAGAWGPCYLGALGTIAKNEGIDVSEANVSVHVTLNEDGKEYALSAELDVHIPGIPIEEAQKLADKTHSVCPYSKAVRNNIDVRVTAI